MCDLQTMGSNRYIKGGGACVYIGWVVAGDNGVEGRGGSRDGSDG